MQQTTFNYAKNHFSEMYQQVIENQAVLLVTQEDNDNVVMMPQSLFDAWQKQAQQLTIPKLNPLHYAKAPTEPFQFNQENELQTLKELIQGIKKHDEYKNHSEKLKFPVVADIKKAETHMSIIVEQAEKLLSIDKNLRIAGFNECELDRVKLCSQFIEDIRLFYTDFKIDIGSNIIASYGQQVITSKALFNIARARELKESYSNVELNDNVSAYESFSVPFIIRLAIENKLKGMIGFESSDVTFYDRKKKQFNEKLNTDEFPTSLVIKFLKNGRLIESPCSFLDIENIYKWACAFTHTGKREYIWLKLKALECLHDLFAYEINKKYKFSPDSETKIENFTETEFKTFKRKLNKLFYLKPEIEIEKLMYEMNNNFIFKKKYKFSLSYDNFDENCGFYNKKYNIHI
jgi:PHD/YefM family antitoxin component YafN of YafNO toxin-antitoxin module